MTGRAAFRFLCACLAGDGAAEARAALAPLREAGETAWQELVRMAGAQQITTALGPILRARNLADLLPADLADYFDGMATLNRQRNERVRVEAAELASLLNDAGVNPVFLKGGANLLDGTRAIVLVSPNNPSGAIYSAECLLQFLQLAVEKNIALIVDETYRDFIDERFAPHALFTLPEWRDSFVHLYSFSKVYSLTGFRVGAIVAGEKIRAQLEKIQDCVAISAPHIGQLAALYGLDHLDNWKREKARELIAKAKAIGAAFEHRDLEYKLISAGAYFAYIRHPFDADAHQVAKRLAIDFQLLCLPGTYFGEGQQRYLRFAFANLDGSTFEAIVDRLLLSQA